MPHKIAVASKSQLRNPSRMNC